MNENVFLYPLIIKEAYLDVFGHVNNAMYLTLFEEARWDFLTKKGYGLQKILATNLGPVVLEIKISYLKELRLREEVVIETKILSYEKMIGKLIQRMLRDNEECCTVQLSFGLFDLKERKLVPPSLDWVRALG
jgi:YbgC/YbaW family acyl-CoA thioester hydrolase